MGAAVYLPLVLPALLAPFACPLAARLDYAVRAEVHSLRARQVRGEGYVRSRVLDEIRLAKVRLAQREPDLSAAVATHAIQLAAETRSSLVVNRLTGFGRELTARHPDAPGIVGFRDRLRDYLRKTAPTRLGDVP